MRQAIGIELPASFLVTVSHAETEMLQAAPADNDIQTVAEVALLLKCKPVIDLQSHSPSRSGEVR